MHSLLDNNPIPRVSTEETSGFDVTLDLENLQLSSSDANEPSNVESFQNHELQVAADAKYAAELFAEAEENEEEAAAVEGRVDLLVLPDEDSSADQSALAHPDLQTHIGTPRRTITGRKELPSRLTFAPWPFLDLTGRLPNLLASSWRQPSTSLIGSNQMVYLWIIYNLPKSRIFNFSSLRP
ncbi:uncharacterized protein BDZ99DRAFT_193167 [Mytilinidion resinicola]|uniref:Uncharacterized protein n=1 Tax=Mytilinidion resinicola TaxID=574789 RepID=A0A6A6Z2N2_9PEZI|nr:uncharacterized protein BDZ99DRAFT_193167 [Mytilinidion resinicola]KAF2815260.1 hypothetical protein BDZ99DRAFT_193167 [Mytilinidion resinicola]